MWRQLVQEDKSKYNPRARTHTDIREREHSVIDVSDKMYKKCLQRPLKWKKKHLWQRYFKEAGYSKVYQSIFLYYSVYNIGLLHYKCWRCFIIMGTTNSRGHKKNRLRLLRSVHVFYKRKGTCLRPQWRHLWNARWLNPSEDEPHVRGSRLTLLDAVGCCLLETCL